MLATRTKESMFLENKKTNYNGIDLIKFICAFLVLIIHVDPFPEDSFEIFKYFNFGLQQYVCRLAVPFFFMASGFFLFRKMDLHNISKSMIRNYCFNLLRILGVWSVLLVVGGQGHLWYLGATVVAIFVLSILFQRGLKSRYLLVIAGILYIIGLVGDSYYGITESLRQISVFDYVIKTYEFFFRRTKNGVFMGLLFVLIGALFAHKKIRMNMIVAVVGFIASMGLLFGEVFLLKYYDIPKDYNMYVFLVPASLCLFCIASGIKLKDRPIYKKLRVIGVVIYFSHLLVNKSIEFGVEIIKKFTGLDFLPYMFVMTVVLTTVLAFLVEHLSNNNKFRWLRWLYS